MEKLKSQIESHNSPNFLKSKMLHVYTGIEPSQLENLSDDQRGRIFTGLTKQFELVGFIHGDETKSQIDKKIKTFLSGETTDINTFTASMNSLLVFGNVRDLNGTGVEFLHERLSHFWRILGWEELQKISSCDVPTKTRVDNLNEVFTYCGNLIRTLDLLAEQWEDKNIGPRLIFPRDSQRLTLEESDGYAFSKLQTDYTNTIVFVASRNNKDTNESRKEEFSERNRLLNRLLNKYPIEFAYAIFDYYAFTQNWSEKAYNTSIIQEYVHEGTTKIKGIINGKTVVLRGQVDHPSLKVNQELLNHSNKNSVNGSDSSNFVLFESEISKGDIVTLIQGKTASAILKYPEIVTTFSTNFKNSRNKIVSFASAISDSKTKQPVVSFQSSTIKEYSQARISSEAMTEVGKSVKEYAISNGLKFIHVEAGHIHADTMPTERQKVGMRIGSALVNNLQDIPEINLYKSTMIDEDHVPNVLDHTQYVSLMKSLDYKIDEVIYESSPVVREISVLAIKSLLEKFPTNIYQEGEALIFNIPNTQLQVELIKNVNVSPFELGCVIFDIGLTLYKIYPELGEMVYGNGRNIHDSMQGIYSEFSNLGKRQAQVREKYPYLTNNIAEIANRSTLPILTDKNSAIINVLEGFYTPQQTKLVGILKALSIPISLVNVTFSHEGMKYYAENSK